MLLVEDESWNHSTTQRTCPFRYTCYTLVASFLCFALLSYLGESRSDAGAESPVEGVWRLSDIVSDAHTQRRLAVVSHNHVTKPETCFGPA